MTTLVARSVMSLKRRTCQLFVLYVPKADHSLYDIIKHTDFHVVYQTINMLKDVYKTLCFSLSRHETVLHIM